MDNSYKNLDVYTRSKELVKQVYKVVNNFPLEERFALSSQIRRAIISVPSNIAEGLSRSAIKEQCHFLDIAYGSLMEADCQLEIACDLSFHTKEEYSNINITINDVARMLIGLKKHRTSPANC
jgi:four helix bundle protein